MKQNFKNLYEWVVQKVFICTIFLSLAQRVDAAGHHCCLGVDIDNGYKPGALTENFVKEVLREHGFNEEVLRHVTVLVLPKQGFSCIGSTIYIPFNDEHFLKAQELKYNHKSNIVNVSENKNIFFYDHMNGDIITEESLDLWRGLLIHEMSHVLHKDTSYRVWVSGLHAAMGLYMIYPPRKLSSFLKTFFITITMERLSGFVLAYGQEYRADQEAIDRIKDPAIVLALYHFFNSYDAYLKRNKDSNGWLSFDEHPAPCKRAERFKQAYEKLIKEQILKRETSPAN